MCDVSCVIRQENQVFDQNYCSMFVIYLGLTRKIMCLIEIIVHCMIYNGIYFLIICFLELVTSNELLILSCIL